MEEEIIEKVVKEFDSKKETFPSKNSEEGEKMVETIRKETISNDK